MPRTKGGSKTRARRKRVLKQAKGYRGARRKLYGVAKETVDRALAYAYIGRKLRKRQYRQLWSIRINAAVRRLDWTYSQFIHGLKCANVTLDRRSLAQLAVEDSTAFEAVVDIAKKHAS